MNGLPSVFSAWWVALSVSGKDLPQRLDLHGKGTYTLSTAFPSVFPIWWITYTAVISSIAGFGILYLLRSKLKLETRELIWPVLVTGLSVFAWRGAGNIPTLNDDPVPPFSPNDLLCPVVAFVCLEMLAAIRPPRDLQCWARVRALLVLVVFLVNVTTI